MSAAEALPPVSPWRDTSHLDHIPTAAELAACPPVDPAVHDRNRRFLTALSTQAAWQSTAEPFTVRELYQDALDEAEEIFDGADEPAAQYALVERLLDWPQNEKSGWE